MHIRIRKNANDADGFDIPVAPNRPAKSLKVRLGKGKSAKYDVWQKEMPANLPAMVTVEGDSAPSQVTWFNNYGIKHRKNNADTTDADPFEDVVDHDYTLELDAEPGKRYVIYTGGSTAKAMTVVKGKATIRINLGDPPTGHIG
jgi:hypothetical protein